MGKDAGRHRLEELQWRAGDHQHVEDVAGGRRTLKTADDQRAGVEEGLFAEHDQQDRGGEATATAQRELGPVGVLALRYGTRSGLLALGPAGEGEGDDHQAEAGGGDDPDRHRRLAAQQADRDEDREQGAKDRFGEDQGREEPEAAVAGEEATGKVARRVEHHRGEEDPVEGFVSLKQAILERPAQGQRQRREKRRQAELDFRRHPHRLADRLGRDQPFGDVPGEQLFDRPVKGRDGDEDRRPEHGDLPVVGLGQHVRCDEEIGVGDDPREADADCEEARRLAVVGRRRVADVRGLSPGAWGFRSRPHQRSGLPRS